jgi:hypothetical protein
MRGSRKDVHAAAENGASHGGFAHGAVVRAVTAAAGRETRVIGFSEKGRKRTNGEEESEEDGESAPHLHRWYTRLHSSEKGGTLRSGIID